MPPPFIVSSLPIYHILFIRYNHSNLHKKTRFLSKKLILNFFFLLNQSKYFRLQRIIINKIYILINQSIECLPFRLPIQSIWYIHTSIDYDDNRILLLLLSGINLTNFLCVCVSVCLFVCLFFFCSIWNVCHLYWFMSQ